MNSKTAETTQVVSELLDNARSAMAQFCSSDQSFVDESVTAIAWALYKKENARTLAELAVANTGLGNVADKVTKNQRKTFGTLRDLMRVHTVGVIEELPEKGLVKYAKPVGVVGAITPSTNPAATPVNKCMMALKGRNAIIVAPSPAGWKTTNHAVELMRRELATVGAPENLIQNLPEPVTRPMTEELMRQVDLVVVTGSQNNVRGAYSSGTPAIGVGAGNVPVIVDDSADLVRAAELIGQSKTFDNGTSCSSENSVLVIDSVYDEMIEAFGENGGYLATAEEKQRIVDSLWTEQKSLNRELIAKDIDQLISICNLGADPRKTRFILVEETGTGSDYPLSGEKLSLFLTVYRVGNFEEAVSKVKDILAYQGAGHSCGIHTADMTKAHRLAQELDVVRVLVNQAHTFGNGGGFTSGFPFTLSMGCGTWGGNSISENLNYRHFINITHLSTTIPEDKPSEESLFGNYLRKHYPDQSI